MKTESIKAEIEAIFGRFGLSSVVEGGLPVNTPLTGEQVASVRSDTSETVTAIIERAQIAQVRWGALEIATRAEFLKFVAGKISENSADSGKLLHYDSGKSVRESSAEIASAAGLINGTVKAASYDLLPNGAERSKEFTPLGVIAVISPFNFALAISLWTGAPALLAGNTVINKPSEKTPLVALLFEAIFKNAIEEFNQQSGDELIPENTFQLAIGGPAIGKQIVGDRRVAKVVFTGSINGCENIKKADEIARRRAKALTEGGAANFAIISDKHTGTTPEKYVKFVVGALMKSFLPYAGQKCINTRQVFVHESLADAVVREFED